MSYLSMKNVLPIYYNARVSQKGLRNDDSIEMLGIIRDARYFEPSLVYGWTTNLYNSLSGQLVTGNGNVASLIASNRNKIAEKIAATMELVKWSSGSFADEKSLIIWILPLYISILLFTR